MIEQDFDRIKEIAKELNEIRVRNDLRELQLTASERQYTWFEDHKEWNEVTLITRGEHQYRDCKIVNMKQNKETKEIEEMDYDEYMNYNTKWGN